jgi:hypothetical protein
MNLHFRICLLFAITIIIFACKPSELEKQKEQSQAEIIPPTTVLTKQEQQSNTQSTPALSGSAESEEQGKYFADIFTDLNHLSYQGYDIRILEESIIDKAYRDTPIDVTYALVKKGGKVSGKFDGVYFGIGNATKFGLFNFLGSKTQELAISQTVPRGGRHWIVRLHPYYKVIFDSANYEVGREEVEIIDMDNDGIYEIGLAVTAFYLVFDFSMSETPLPFVIFKYDKKTDRYLPANHLFQSHLLQGTDERISNLSKDSNTSYYLSDRVALLLDYLYAGKEKEGWAFFDQTYTLPDKETVKAKVRKVLKKGRAFQFIKNSQRKTRSRDDGHS